MANYKQLTPAEAKIEYDLQKKNLISLFNRHKHVIKESMPTTVSNSEPIENQCIFISIFRHIQPILLM